jgi:hypothetical protein
MFVHTMTSMQRLKSKRGGVVFRPAGRFFFFAALKFLTSASSEQNKNPFAKKINQTY